MESITTQPILVLDRLDLAEHPARYTAALVGPKGTIVLLQLIPEAERAFGWNGTLLART
jgi:hypothetical protein